jgi:hypothetical protein
MEFHVHPSISNEATLGNPETIIWSSIQHLCSRDAAESIALHLYKISRKKDRTALAANLKLYIQQASEFYHAAAAAKPNTAPLIYYYSFLNLAKALCELKKPRLHERRECYAHGISWRPDPRRVVDLRRERVTIVGRGMWHALWETLMLTTCPAMNPTLLVSNLFSYCPEISSEFIRVFGNRRLGYVDLEKPDVLFDEGRRETWLTFSVPRWDLKARKISAPRLLQQIAGPQSSYVEVKSTDKESRRFETASPKAVGKREAIWSAIEPDILAINTFTHLDLDGKLRYLIPLQRRVPFPLPQVVVSYSILFWLGSLVRYDPHSVHWLMDSGYWVLIDGFMSQSRMWLLELFEWAFFRTETTLCVLR